MGKVCVSCGADIDDPMLPDDEEERCPDCEDQPEEMDDEEDMDEGSDEKTDEDFE